MKKIIIIDYGAGNVQSVKFALQRLGVSCSLSSDTDEINTADKIIFPGVGEASSAMLKLKQKNIDRLLPQLKQPILGICLGMQLMCSYSEEGETKCLGIFKEEVKKFEPLNKVPHMGWNSVNQLKGSLFNGIKENTYLYFVHSYYVPLCPETIAVSNYICNFSASIHKNNFYACQFHPEKSGDEGSVILQNFLNL